jgi:hypothetical protein
VVSDLAELDMQTPRPDELCARFARRMDPWWGFVIAGGLFMLVGLIVPTLVLIALGPRLGMVDGSHAAQVFSLGGEAIGALVAWKLFARWRNARLGAKRELIRAGKLVDMTVDAQLSSLLRSRRYSHCVRLSGGGVTLDCGFNLWFAPSPGETVHLLYKRGLVPVLAFDASGRMYNGQVL